jgi:27-O-demethylrifamycin SV methyltransferase
LSDVSHDAASHYDRVTQAWNLLLGDDLHYGVFRDGTEELPVATSALTELMLGAAAIDATTEVLDVGCGTGAPACLIARRHGARITGITTSAVGISAAQARASAEGVAELATFELGDGTANGRADASYDRAWILESSHLMAKPPLISESARVLRPGGRVVLCDVMLRRPMPFVEVRRLRKPLGVLREVFGDAHMIEMDTYAALFEDNGVAVSERTDLTTATQPTFDRWRNNADRYAAEVTSLLGAEDLALFIEACDVLEGFWADGTLGYGLIAGIRA